MCVQEIKAEKDNPMTINCFRAYFLSLEASRVTRPYHYHLQESDLTVLSDQEASWLDDKKDRW